MAASLVGALAFGAVGCDNGGGEEDAGQVDAGPLDGDGGRLTDAGVSDAGPPIDGGGGADDAGPLGVDAGPSTSGWTVRSHGCPGPNRADALWVDTDGTMWVGCGSNVNGDGLWMSTDDGASWAIPDTSPANVLTSFEVLSIHRGYGGLLYVGGQGPASTGVLSLDTGASPFAAAAVLTRGGTVGFSFRVSPFVTTDDGRAFADSFTGHDALYRPDDTVGDTATDWTNARDWEFPSGSHQILDMVVRDGRFVAVGSTIAEPPYVMVPTDDSSADPFSMTPVQLVDGLGAWDGEMWGVAANASRIVAAGVDQTNNGGKIFVSGADVTDAADYTQIDVGPLVDAASGGQFTWARGVCMEGDRIAVVGEVQPLRSGGGFVLYSADGGVSWSDESPESSPATWSKCQFNGARLVVAGGGIIALNDTL